MRGKDCFYRRNELRKAGSPPPMRGKEFAQFMKSEYHRITPAYAGKRPRSTIYLQVVSGSPPPMRGKARFHLILKLSPRITPAYAGKSHFSEIVLTENKDHPRLCGEK